MYKLTLKQLKGMVSMHTESVLFIHDVGSVFAFIGMEPQQT